MQPNDQSPIQPPQPEQSPQNQPGNSTPRGRILQPLSSEESIRKEAEDARPAPRAYESVSSPEPTPLSPDAGQLVDTYESNLVTEPIQRPQAYTPPATTESSAVSQQSGNGRKKLSMFIALGATLLIAGGVSAYLILFSGRVSSSDLVETTYKSTQYLRPKQWSTSPSVISSQELGSYGDWTGKDKNKLGSAAVIVNETQSMPLLANADDSTIEQLRQQLLARAETDQSTSIMGGSNVAACTSTTNTSSKADTEKTDTTTGLITITSTCNRDDGLKITTKMRIIAGNDGIVRAIAITATERSWAINGKPYSTILSSVTPKK